MSRVQLWEHVKPCCVLVWSGLITLKFKSCCSLQKIRLLYGCIVTELEYCLLPRAKGCYSCFCELEPYRPGKWNLYLLRHPSFFPVYLPSDSVTTYVNNLSNMVGVWIIFSRTIVIRVKLLFLVDLFWLAL